MAAPLLMATLWSPAVLAVEKTNEDSQQATPSTEQAEVEEATAKLEAVRKGALQHLSGESLVRLRDMPADQLLALLNSDENAQRTDDEKEIIEAVNKEAFERTLKYETGTIQLRGGLATLSLGTAFRYLNPDEAQRLLVDAWGNPPGGKSLGMIIPVGTSPLHAKEGWGVIITYSEDGHVKDDDAQDIDYDELLKGMQEDTKASNEARVAEGYAALELVGWAQPPHYDAQAHRLYWAKELSLDGSPENTLNYSIRILGRKGVLELNAVAGISQLSRIAQDMKQVLPLAEFETGQTYADFDPQLDQVAAYGIGGLIAGKVLAKVGLFAGLLKLLVVAKKFLIFGALGLGAVVMKWFKGRSQE